MSIVTDAKGLEEPKNPTTCNVFALIKFFATKEKQKEIAKKYRAGDYGYGHAKLELLQIILDYFKDARMRYIELEKNFDLVLKRLEKGNKIASEIVDKKYIQMMKIV
jgi:tryptophanyl-tRNA synthetase